MRCLSSAKMNMLADVLKPSDAPESTGTGHWRYTQEADSGAITRLWTDDDPNTLAVEGHVIKDMPCMVRGIIVAGVRGQANTQAFSAIYENIEWVRMDFPATYNVTKADRIIRIRDRFGTVIWKEEESDGLPPTTFAVMGVTPVVNGFGRQVENFALLKRTDVQV